MITKGRRKSDNVEKRGRVGPSPWSTFSDKHMVNHPAMDGLRRRVLDSKAVRGANKGPKAMDKAAERDKSKRMKGPRLPNGNPFDSAKKQADKK